jgi:threonine dehydratase
MRESNAQLNRLSSAAVAAVERVIRGYVRLTPVITIDRAELGLPAGPLTLKLEQLQHAGSFKARGAFANLLLRDVPAAGVVAASGGNHGAAVAYAAGVLGLPARVFVPEVSSPAKISRIRGYGADLLADRYHADRPARTACALRSGTAASGRRTSRLPGCARASAPAARRSRPR